MSEASRRAQIRAQMRDFYQFDTSSPQRQGLSTQPAKTDGPAEMDLDSERFDVQKFTTDLLQTKSLKQLVETDTELLRNIRRLDGELQDLVYDNYSKFISATDTIRQMKENVSDMDSKLKALSSNVSHIDKVSRVISDSLQSHRTKLEEMLVVNKMLRKVHFLIELPERMRTFLVEKRYHMAVRFWVAGDNVLTKHKGISTFEKTHEQCRVTAWALYKELEKAVMECALVANDDGTNVIRRLVEDMRLMRATSIFPHPQGAPTDADQRQFYSEIQTSLLKVAEEEMLHSVADARSQLSAACSLSEWPVVFSSCAEVEAHVPIAQVRQFAQQLPNIFSTFTKTCERCFDVLNQIDDASTEESNEALQGYVMGKVVPQLCDVGQWALELISDVGVAVVRGIATAKKLDVEIPKIKDSAVSALSTVVKCIKALSQCLKSVTTTICPMDVSSLSSLIDDKVLRFLQLLQSTVDNVMGGPNATATASLVVALLCKIIPKFCVGELATVATIDVTQFRQWFLELCKKALHCYVVRYGNELLSSVSFHASIAEHSVNAPSETIIRIAAAIRAAHNVHHDWFPPEAKHNRISSSGSAVSHHSGNDSTLPGGSGSRSLRSSGGSGFTPITYQRKEHQSLLSEVDRALSKASAVLLCTPAVCEDVLVTESLMIFVCKGLVERVRHHVRFEGGWFQCCQLDATYFAMLSQKMLQSGWIRRDALLLSLLSEWVTCVFERSVARSPLPVAMMEKLLEPLVTSVLQ